MNPRIYDFDKVADIKKTPLRTYFSVSMYRKGVNYFKVFCLDEHLDKCPEEFSTVEDNDYTADDIDDAECFICELGTEK